MPVVVQTALNNGKVDLMNYQEHVLAQITLTGGNVLVQGKLFVNIGDPDPQGIKGRLTHQDGSIELDVVDLQSVAPGTGHSICLTGWITGAAAGDIVDLRCASFMAAAGYARLTATYVDTLT